MLIYNSISLEIQSNGYNLQSSLRKEMYISNFLRDPFNEVMGGGADMLGIERVCPLAGLWAPKNNLVPRSIVDKWYKKVLLIQTGRNNRTSNCRLLLMTPQVLKYI